MSARSLRADAHGSPRGFTLAELLIAIVLFGLVMGGLMQAIVRQQRFHRGASAVVEMRGQMRQAIFALPTELRAVYPAGGDIYEWSASGIAFRAIVGSGIVCVRPTVNTVVLPPLTLTKANTLTTWLNQPQVGDSILIYDEGIGIGNNDDAWIGYRITGMAQVTGVNACPTTSGFTAPGDAAASSWQLTLSANLPTTTIVGAPVRFVRRVEYELYEAADARWYLGATDCITGRTPECGSLQPVSGPFRPYNVNPLLSGLHLRYYDVNGNELDPTVDAAASIASIGVTVRGMTDTPFGSNDATTRYKDSLTFTVGLRNRN